MDCPYEEAKRGRPRMRPAPAQRRTAKHVKKMKSAWEARMRPKDEKLKRGAAKQMPVREAELSAKKSAMAFRRWVSSYGIPLEDAAMKLGMAARTLNGWETDRRRKRLGPLPRGRKAERPGVEKRNDIVAVLRELGPHVGMPTLQGLFSDIARGVLWDLLSRFRELCLREDSRILFALRWARVGAVWAMDFAEPPAPIDGEYTPCGTSLRAGNSRGSPSRARTHPP